MAQIRQLAGLAFDRHEEGVLGQVLAQPRNQGPAAARIQMPATHSTNAAMEDPSTSRRIANAVASTGHDRLQATASHITDRAAPEGRVDAGGRAQEQSGAGDAGRAEADREEASTWANAFIAHAQQAADAAEANAHARMDATQRSAAAEGAAPPGKGPVVVTVVAAAAAAAAVAVAVVVVVVVVVVVSSHQVQQQQGHGM